MRLLFNFLFLFFLLLPSLLHCAKVIYTVGPNRGEADNLMAFAALHHYNVTPLYEWESAHYVVDDTMVEQMQMSKPIHTRARLLNHQLHDETNYIRKREGEYGVRYGLVQKPEETNFYFPSKANAHYVHYNLDVVPPTINGSGITVYIPDGGMQTDHAAFSRNGGVSSSCDPLRGFSVCNDNLGTLPADSQDVHATMCASLICAGSGLYGSGIAPSATCVPRRYICINRMWTIIDEARGNALATPGILSVSNGPPDFMMYYEFPPKPLMDGIEESAGRGAIRFDAGGNGAEMGDNCAFDWTVSTRFTPGIGAISSSGTKETYSETCPGIFAVGFGAGGSNYIYTAFPSATKKDITNIFDGTSAAAPQYAGIGALLLQVNKHLDQRNMIHAMINSMSTEGIFDYDYPFDTNAAGYKHSNGYGFGYINVTKAIGIVSDPQWQALPVEKKCLATVLSTTVNADDPITHIKMDLSSCDIAHVEYVNLRLTFLVSSTASISSISLISPSGTQAMFLEENHFYRIQNLDFFSGGWTWYGEDAKGIWTFEIGALDDFDVNAASIFVYGY